MECRKDGDSTKHKHSTPERYNRISIFLLFIIATLIRIDNSKNTVAITALIATEITKLSSISLLSSERISISKSFKTLTIPKPRTPIIPKNTINTTVTTTVSYQKIFSKFLNKEMNFSICQPKCCKNEAINTLFFLHGRMENETLIEQLNMDTILSDLLTSGVVAPVRIICPCLDNSSGINSSSNYHIVRGKYANVYKGRYEDYFIDELIPYIDRRFPVKERYIGGISSGGYTALSLGLRHPEMFSKIGGHMPAIDLKFEDEDEIYFADQTMWCSYDPILLAEKSHVSNIQFYLDDGLQDEGGFFKACEKLNDILKKRGAQVELHLSEGHHTGMKAYQYLSDK